MVEMVVVVAVIVILAALAIPLYADFQSGSQLDTVTKEIVHALREAQMRTIGGDGDLPWGVYFYDAPTGTGDSFTLFAGATHAGRDADMDIVTQLPGSVSFSSITFTGGSAVVFSKVRGTTVNSGDVVLISTDGDLVAVSVNAAGTVNIE